MEPKKVELNEDIIITVKLSVYLSKYKVTQMWHHYSEKSITNYLELYSMF